MSVLKLIGIGESKTKKIVRIAISRKTTFIYEKKKLLAIKFSI
jgi:hypothetical protein